MLRSKLHTWGLRENFESNIWSQSNEALTIRSSNAMNTRFLTLLTTLAFLGFSVTVAAHPCDRAPGHKHCDSDPGGGGSSVVYTAELIHGAFKFNVLGSEPAEPVSVDVTLVRDIGLLSNVRLDMILELAENGATWDQVFNTCQELLVKDSVDGFTVFADNWSIEQPGGVRVIFRDIVLPDAVVTVQLIGDQYDLFLPEDPQVIGSGNATSIVHKLGNAAIYGRSPQGVHPKKGCQPKGSGGFKVFLLYTPSRLIITATRH
jgi:hypothetical protein